MAAQKAAAALLDLRGHVLRSAGGAKAVEAMMLLPDGRERVEAAATKQKREAGKSYNNKNNLDMSGTTATQPRAPPRTSPAGPTRGSPRASSWCRAGPRVCALGLHLVLP
jgi:hypothetical protein